MLEALFQNLLARVPELATMVLFVYLFIRYLASRDKDFQESQADRDAMIRDLNKESNRCISSTQETIKKNSEILGQVKESLHNNTLVLDKVAKALDKSNGG